MQKNTCTLIAANAINVISAMTEATLQGMVGRLVEKKEMSPEEAQEFLAKNREWLEDIAEKKAEQKLIHQERCSDHSGRVCVPPYTVWVTAYSVTREYGGPQEGGWWYDWREPVETVRVDSRNAEAIHATVARLMEEHVYEGRRSFRDAHNYEEVLVEEEPQASQSTEVPYYC